MYQDLLILHRTIWVHGVFVCENCCLTETRYRTTHCLSMHLHTGHSGDAPCRTREVLDANSHMADLEESLNSQVAGLGTKSRKVEAEIYVPLVGYLRVSLWPRVR